MPHVTIKHFPRELTPEQTEALAAKITDLVTETFEVPETAVSIALEPVPKDVWMEQVYRPEITENADRVIRKPGY